MPLCVSSNNGSISDDNETSTEQEFWRNCRKYAREYNEATGIHGLRYITEKKRSVAEKIFWTIILSVCLGGCIYMIYEILYKYNNTPVVVTFATEDTPIHQIPFPAITICPESKYSRKRFRYGELFKKFTRNESLDDDQLKKLFYMSMVCDLELEKLRYTNKTMEEEFYDNLDEFKLELNETLLICSHGEKFETCQKYFTPVLIDEGICYSYNILDKNEIFREHVFNYLDYYSVKNGSQKFFDVESGYKDNAGATAYPRRALSSGAANAISIMLYHNTNNWDVACTPFLQGFRILVHTPWDVPRLSKHYFVVPLDTIVVASMEPELVTTSEAVRRFAPEKRKCYMRNERPLQHFLEYSQPNCLLECITNYTLNRCRCVQFFMPRDNKTAVCGTGNLECVREAEEDLMIYEFEAKIKKQPICDCKPSCTSLNFNIETSSSNVYLREYIHFQEDIKLEDLEILKFSMLQIYFKNEQFITKERNELYGISDLISNLGGLLGLFTGFSLISAAELIYFCSLRLYYNKRMYGTWAGTRK